MMDLQRFHSSYDVIVVGGGLGGLSAALTIAAGQKSVLLLERHNMTGGCATSFVRGRYEFEVSIHEMAVAGDGKDGRSYGAARAVLDNLGVSPEYVMAPEPFRIRLLKNGLDFTMPYGFPNCIKAVIAKFPKYQKNIERFYNLAIEIASGFGYMSTPSFDPEVLAEKYPNFMRTLDCSVADVIDELELPQEVLDVLSAYYTYLTVDLNELSFHLFCSMNISYCADGAYLFNHTSHDLAVKMEKRAREFGAQIETNVCVSRLLTKDGAVCGVRTSDGTEIQAKRVLCNFSPNVAYTKMLDKKDVPESALKLVGARKLGATIYDVYLGLDALPEEMGIDTYECYISEDMNPEASNNRARSWKITQTAATCPDVAIPHFTGEDRCQLSFTVCLDVNAMVGHTDPDQYQLNKEEFTSELIALYEKVTGASIRDHVEEVAVATPATFARYTCSPYGNLYGYQITAVDGMLPRLMAEKAEQFIPGVDFVGSYGRMLHGYSSAILSGAEAAGETLKMIGG